MNKSDWTLSDRNARCTIAYGVIAAMAGAAILYWFVGDTMDSLFGVRLPTIGTYFDRDRIDGSYGAVVGFLLVMFVGNVVRHFKVSIDENR